MKEIHNVRIHLRGKQVVLTWQAGETCHMVKRETAQFSAEAVLWCANKLLADMEADPDGSKMLEVGRG